MADLTREWEKKSYGTIIGSNSRVLDGLTYVMFADGTTLMVKSKRVLRKMLASIKVGRDCFAFESEQMLHSMQRGNRQQGLDNII